MAYEGQHIGISEQGILDDLLHLTSGSLGAVDQLLTQAAQALRDQVCAKGRVSAALVEQNQTAAHGLAWLATYAEALKQMQQWAEKLNADSRFGAVEALILQIAFGEYLCQIHGGIPISQSEIIRSHDMGISDAEAQGFVTKEVGLLIQDGNTQKARLRLVALMQENNADVTVGISGLDEELEMIRDQFRRYARERIEPVAHEWHLKDELIPMEIIDELAEMGVFGLTIPEINEDWIQQFADGLSTVARKFNCPLVGGDLSSGPLQIAIQVHGLVPEGQATLRSGAQIGDSILVTGTLGDAAVALLGLGYQSHLDSNLELLGRADPQPLFERYFSPSPRVEFAIGCRGLVNAAIDISDGLLSDLSHILRASGFGAEIEEVTLPFSATAQACLSEKMLLQACLNGGDDYELCLIVSQDLKDRVFQAAQKFDLPLTEVGIIKDVDGIRLKARDETMVAVKSDGYIHF